MHRLIFDFGAHQGKNLSYYLIKAEKVVAIEANPELALQLRQKFRHEIIEGRLFIEECLVTTSSLIQKLGRRQNFYLNTTDSLTSTIKEIQFLEAPKWKKIAIDSYTSSEIILKHLKSEDVLYYCKFDLEGLDPQVVNDLFSSGLNPMYISYELNEPRALDAIISNGAYSGFKLSRGSQIGTYMRNAEVRTISGSINNFEFEVHSAGPIFPDLPKVAFSSWAIKFISHFRYVLQDWTDIHASRVTARNSGFVSQLLGIIFLALLEFTCFLKEHLPDLIVHKIKKIVRTMRKLTDSLT